MDGIGKNLKRIRLLKNLSLKDAGNLLNMTATAISKYEKGEILLDSKKLIDFANAYNVKSIELLKVYNTPKMKFTSFRKKKRLTGQNLELLEELIQDEVAKYLEIINMNNINPDNRFADFDGLSEIVNNIPVIVLLDGIKDGARQRFTIAHELGHLILNINNDELDEERLCNRFASALLMPKEAIINEFGYSRGNINFFELTAFKNEFKVSYTAIVYRLKDLNIISEYLYKKLSIFLSQRIGKNDPKPIQPETSFQFKKIVYKLEADEIISVNKACELLGVTVDEYNNEDNNY